MSSNFSDVIQSVDGGYLGTIYSAGNFARGYDVSRLYKDWNNEESYRYTIGMDAEDIDENIITVPPNVNKIGLPADMSDV